MFCVSGRATSGVALQHGQPARSTATRCRGGPSSLPCPVHHAAQKHSLPIWSGFLCPGGDLSRQTTETPPAFLNFNRSSSLSRGSLVIHSRGWKLQHGSGLAGNQARDLHNLAVREFKRIVMRVWIGHIDLTKPCNLVI